MTLTSTSPDLGVGVGTVSTSIVQSATEVPFPAEVTTSRFISLGISEAVMVGYCFLERVYETGTWHGLLPSRCVGGGAKFEIRICKPLTHKIGSLCRIFDLRFDFDGTIHGQWYLSEAFEYKCAAGSLRSAEHKSCVA